MITYGIKGGGGGKLSLIPSPSFFTCREARRNALHGEEKRACLRIIMIEFQETVDYTGHSILS